MDNEWHCLSSPPPWALTIKPFTAAERRVQRAASAGLPHGPVRNATRRAGCLGERWTAVQSDNNYHSVRERRDCEARAARCQAGLGPVGRQRFTSTSAFSKTKSPDSGMNGNLQSTVSPAVVLTVVVLARASSCHHEQASGWQSVRSPSALAPLHVEVLSTRAAAEPAATLSRKGHSLRH